MFCYADWRFILASVHALSMVKASSMESLQLFAPSPFLESDHGTFCKHTVFLSGLYGPWHCFLRACILAILVLVPVPLFVIHTFSKSSCFLFYLKAIVFFIFAVHMRNSPDLHLSVLSLHRESNIELHNLWTEYNCNRDGLLLKRKPYVKTRLRARWVES